MSASNEGKRAQFHRVFSVLLSNSVCCRFANSVYVVLNFLAPVSTGSTRLDQATGLRVYLCQTFPSRVLPL